MTGACGRIALCARANWRMKAALSVGLALFFCVPYFTLQRFPMLPARTLPLSAIDRAIDFDPRWVWAYQSVYLLLAIVPWMATTRAELRHYARGFLMLSAVGFAFFLLLPIRGPRPDTDTAGLMFRVLRSYDGPLNCFPSLHVGLAAYTVLFGAGLARDRLTASTRRIAVSLAWLWTTLIAYAALATKQHYALDIPAGALVACVCHWWNCHNLQRSMAHAERPTVRQGLSRGPVGVLLRERDGYAATNSNGSARTRR